MRERGTGRITTKGYVQLRLGGKYVLEHVVVWEGANGPIPSGMQIHHKNHEKRDNRLENLELVDPTTHKRIHSGCELRDGVWWKPCHVCGEFKPVSVEHWYFGPNGRWPILGKCRLCAIRASVEGKRRRTARRLLEVRSEDAT